MDMRSHIYLFKVFTLFPQAACSLSLFYFKIQRASLLFCTVSVLIYFTPVVSRSFHFLSLQVLVSCCAFDGSRSIRYDAISHYDSHLHIPSGM